MKRTSWLAIIVALVWFCTATVLPTPATTPDDDINEAHKQAVKATQILDEIMAAPDQGIPNDLLDRAECVAVFPSVIKAAFIVGGKGGKGLVSYRNPQTGAWGAPIFLKIGGGSVGFQIGVEATDLILLGMNRRAVEMFTKDRFELGAEASAAAGPVGRSTSAGTDLPTFSSEFLSYSRSRGAFAGIALKGTVINRDDDLNQAVYGVRLSAQQVMEGNMKAPAQIAIFPQTLAKYAKPHKGE